jgi:aspartate-semialdehyde dehydrogenase|tara:strand:+ start:6578 stop:7567 length:990 start_codon:yes stop_codon:yes gene_type:complete
MKKIAVVGATGLVGRQIVQLCESFFDKSVEYIFYASERSAGSSIKINNQENTIKLLSTENIEKVDLALFSAGGERSREFAEGFLDKGAFVVDNSSAFRLEEEVPLVVYGVNEQVLSTETRLIANPNCTTMVLVMALKPMHDSFALEAIVPTSYQAVSGSGLEATESLERENKLGTKLDENYEEGYYGRPIANNVIPLAGRLTENDYSDEEMKFVNESRKILGIPNLIVEPSNARVGVKTGHGIFCSATFRDEINLEKVIELINTHNGIEYWKDKLPTPLDAEGSEMVYISRIRKGLSSNKVINFWVVGDNLLKGAALNAVQIGKYLLNL